MDKLSTELMSLTEDERVYLQSILNEITESGESPSLNDLWSADYDEIPVDIEEFMTNDLYLGKSLKDDNGNLTVYPYWIDMLKKVFDKDSEITELALSGAIGLGKTSISVIALCYILYKLLCLKNPTFYYKLPKGSKIAIAFFNINMDQAYGVGYAKMQSFMKQSPWFLEHGTLYGRTYQTYYPGKNIEILVGSKTDHFIGRDIFAGLLDELNFAPGSDVEFEKSSILKLYNTVKRRIESRFMKMGKVPGLLCLVSSKNTEFDFLEQYISKNKHKKSMYLVDEPIWVVKSNMGLYSGQTFNLAVGNRYYKSRILDNDEDIEVIEKTGQQVIEVPIEHKEAFELDMTTALADIAGIAISSSTKFFSNTDKILACYKPYLKNPFKSEIITISFDGNDEIKDFLNLDLIPKLNRSKSHYIHIDTSITGDTLGFSMTTYATEKQVRRLSKGQVTDVTDIIHKLVMAVGIRPESGSEIPFHKLRRFIYYLKNELGFNIYSISTDSFQSRDMIQQFKLQGYNAEILSVDRTTDPYYTLRNAVNEGRLMMPKIKYLEDEFLDVELRTYGKHKKIDHTEVGHKDVLDTLAANVYKLNRDHTAPNSNNNINTVIDVNAKPTDEFDDLDSMILPEGTVVIDNY